MKLCGSPFRSLPGRRSSRRLCRLLEEYLTEDSFTRAGVLLRTHTELTSDECLAALGEILSSAQSSPSSPSPTLLRQHLEFLRRCASLGVDVVFPAGSQDIDPTALAHVRESMTLADAAERAYDAGGDVEVLRRSVDLWRHIVAHASLASAYPSLRAALLNDAGGVLLRGAFAGLGGPVLRAARRMLRDSVALTPPISPLRSGRLSNLGLALREEFRRGAGPDVLDEAVRAQREAVASSGTTRRRASALNNLAVTLEDLFLRDHDTAHLDDAIAACEEGLRASGVPDALRTDLRVQLGNTLRRRFRESGSAGDHDRAIGLLSEALEATPTAPAAARPGRLVNLSIALLDRHAETGHVDDLETALDLSSAAVALVGAHSPDRPGCCAQMAAVAFRCYEVRGGLHDLDVAVDLLEQARRDTDPGSTDAQGWTVNLGVILRERARLRGRVDDLVRAIELFSVAVQAAQQSARRASYLNNLGNALRDLAASTGRTADLEESIIVLEQALRATSSRSTLYAPIQVNLAAALQDRYAALGSAADLDRAVSLLEAAKRGATDEPRRLVSLAMVLADRYELEARESDGVRALGAFERGCTSGLDLDPETVLRAADQWGGWCGKHDWWEVAAGAYGLAMTALLMTVRSQLIRDHKESWLRQGPSIASRAAFALASAGHAAQAATALESGRAVLLGETLERDRAELSELEHVHPDLAARYGQCAQRVRALQRWRRPAPLIT
jgi:tetratricopeptide (TPR) repeat protein